MIQIQQDMPDVTGLESIINRFGEVQISIDTDSVKLDIETLDNKLKTPLSRIDKKNIKEVKEYLERFLKRASDCKLELLWSLDKFILKTYPIEIIHIPEYNIEMTDYISVNNGHLVRVDYKDVLEIIAIEMMYRDLDETLSSMEDKLENIGITGIYPSIELTKHFEESSLKLSKIFKISNSPYCTSDSKTSFEYFGKKEFNSTHYRDNVGYSVKHALAIITQSVLNKLLSSNIDFKLCSVSDSGIYFITSYSDADIDKIINESAVVRAFGRRFEVKPKVTVF